MPALRELLGRIDITTPLRDDGDTVEGENIMTMSDQESAFALDAFAGGDQEPVSDEVETEEATAEEEETEEDADEEEPAEASDADDDTDDDDPHPVPRKALISEREKRQAAQVEVARLQGQLDALSQMQAHPQQARDPEAEREAIEAEFYSDPVSTIKKYISEAKNDMLNQQRAVKFDSSVSAAMSRYEDYAETEAKFVQVMKQHPQLRDEMESYQDPAEFAYQWVKDQEARSVYGMSLEEMKANIEKELRAKIEAENGGEEPMVKPQQKSLAGARGSGAGAAGRALIPEGLPTGKLDEWA